MRSDADDDRDAARNARAEAPTMPPPPLSGESLVKRSDAPPGSRTGRRRAVGGQGEKITPATESVVADLSRDPRRER